MPIQKYKTFNARRYKRMFANYLIKYQIPALHEEPRVANIKDISAGGVRFWSADYIPEGALLKVNVLVPPIDLVMGAVGKVVRVRKAGQADFYYIGVNFVEIEAHQQMALNEFIENLSKNKDARPLVPDDRVIVRHADIQFA